MEDIVGGESINSSITSPPHKKIVVKVVDMSDDMLEHVIKIATTAYEKYTIQKDAADYIKKMLDKFYGPDWHCIVGRDFGCCVCHEKQQFAYFYLEETTICLYKTESKARLKTQIPDSK